MFSSAYDSTALTPGLTVFHSEYPNLSDCFWYGAGQMEDKIGKWSKGGYGTENSATPGSIVVFFPY